MISLDERGGVAWGYPATCPSTSPLKLTLNTFIDY